MAAENAKSIFTVCKEVIAIRTTILSYISKTTGAVIGQLPESGGLAVQVAPSPAGEQYFDGTSSDTMSLLFLCKSMQQRDALGTLDEICTALTRNKRHEHGIYSLTVATAPNYVAKEGNFWIYSCIINLKYYNKEGF
ncbi:MAG: hypothetical protein E7504_08630 [Ruminococcus sp.]|nr:hypothetical protein [Ruminococcus sp.]